MTTQVRDDYKRYYTSERVPSDLVAAEAWSVVAAELADLLEDTGGPCDAGMIYAAFLAGHRAGLRERT